MTGGRPAHEPDAPLNPPITMASTYVATGDLEYGRYGNPTWSAFEEVLGTLEGGRALAFASGMAAATTVLDLVGQGGGVVAPRHAYSGTVMALADLESRGRLHSRLVDIADTEAVVAAMKDDEDCALLWIESPTNPALELADIPALAAAAHELGVRVVVDNTFATPLLQQPLSLGADIVVHSATKYLAGHSDVQLGALVTADEEVHAALKGRRDLVGAIPGPFETWLALRGMRTLHVRLDRAQANAAELARRLARHPAVEEVRYPGFGAIVAACRRRRAGRRPAGARRTAVGARDVARRRRVDAGAAAPLEGRGRDHPRGPGATLGRHRGRRGPLGRPGAGARVREERGGGVWGVPRAP